MSLNIQSENINTTICNLLQPIRDEWVNKDIVIPVGKYCGRKGRCTNISVHLTLRGYEICMQFLPYAQQRRGMVTVTTNQTLWDHPDARSIWPVSKFKQVLTLWKEENNG